MSFFTRKLIRFRTGILGAIAALVMICLGLIVPSIIPDQLASAPPGYEDATWIKNLLSILLIGMGILFFVWLVLINRIISHKSKKDYMY